MDPITKKTIYAADEGDLITVANFGSAILDLPFASSASDAERSLLRRHRAGPPARHRGLHGPGAREAARPRPRP